MNHQQLFNKNSKHYAQVRPQYPKKIFEYLASLCHEHQIAWDGACGNGQASVSLAHYFNKIEATDISEQQIAHALQNPKVTYSVQLSENTTFKENQFDLVTIAQALHWFNYDLFWSEVKRVLKPDGVFAAWGYSWFFIEEKINSQFKEKILDILEPYWAPQNQLLWNQYRDVPFPFERLAVPKVEMKMELDLNQLFAYVRSWSATRLCIEEMGDDFIFEAYESIKKVWGDESTRKNIPMHFCMIIGRNTQSDKVSGK